MMTRLDKVRQLPEIFIARATGGGPSDPEYRKLRLELLRDSAISERLPQFVRNCDELSKFWAFIKANFGTYEERRMFRWEEFSALIASLEQNIIVAQPADDDISAILINFDTEQVNIAWQKALERRNHDPEAAITMARTLIESVCKHILDEAGISHSDKDDLPKLYYETAKQLNLAPEQHQEKVFKQILGGCKSVIQGLVLYAISLVMLMVKGNKLLNLLLDTLHLLSTWRVQWQLFWSQLGRSGRKRPNKAMGTDWGKRLVRLQRLVAVTQPEL
jgi:hypothetical protein